MTGSTRHRVRSVYTHLTATHWQAIAWFWAILVGVWVVAMVTLTTATDIRTSVWQAVGTAAPKIFLLIIAIVGASAGLPQQVAHGITRRHASLAAAAFLATTGAAFAGLSVAVHVAEYATFSIMGELDRVTDHPARSLAVAVATLGRTLVTHLGWACAGWLVGLGFYRFGGWVGVAFVTPASLPLVVAEIELGDGRGVNQAPGLLGLGVDIAIGASAIACGAVLGYLVVRRLAIRLT